MLITAVPEARRADYPSDKALKNVASRQRHNWPQQLKSVVLGQQPADATALLDKSSMSHKTSIEIAGGGRSGRLL